MGCCPGSGANVIIQAKNALDGYGGNGNMNTQIDPNAEKVRMEYFGSRTGAVTYHGKRRHYRFGNNTIDRYQDVNPEDVEKFLGLTGFKIVGRDSHKYQASGVDFTEFVPEPAGEVIQEEIPAEFEIIDMPLPPIQPVTTSDAGWIEEEPQALDIEPLPNTVKKIRVAVAGANLDTLLAWLRDEQTGKNRKSAIEAIENALKDRYS